MQFDSRCGVAGAAECVAFFWRAEAERGLVVVSQPADLRLHERAEDGVDEIQDRLTTAEVFGEGNGLAVAAFAPARGVIAENVRVGTARKR
jgi:hypothetical protein